MTAMDALDTTAEAAGAAPLSPEVRRLFRRLRHDETVHVLGASDVPRARPTSESLGGGEEHASEGSAVFGVIDQIASLPAQGRYAARSSSPPATSSACFSTG
jgi:hypothetical protein